MSEPAATPPVTPPDAAAELAAVKAELAALKAGAGKPPANTPPPEDQSLNDKARLQREENERKAGDTKAIEEAVSFSMKAPDFVKQNQAILPAEVAEIFAIAEKENYSNAVEKSSAIKAGIVQSFFAVQANYDLLTPGLKSRLDEYLKMTKTVRQEKAQSIYESVFEPAFETLKRVKKAEALQKGLGAGDDDSYKKKLMAGSSRHYLGEKNNA